MKQWFLVLAFLCACSGGSSVTSTPNAPNASISSTTKTRTVRPFFNGTSDFVQAAKGTVNGTSVSCTFTNTPAQNDIIIFSFGYFHSGSVTVTPPTGVTNISSPTGAGGDSAEFDYLIAGASQSKGPYTYSTSVSLHESVGCVEYTGEDTTTPIDAHGETSINNVTSVTSASVTPVTTGDLPVFDVWNGNSSTYSGLTSGWTDRQDITPNIYQFNIDGPVAALSAVSASLTLTTAGHGGTEMILLKAAGGTPTPSPSPSPYAYHGVQIFNGTAGTNDSVVGADVSGVAKDTNSDSVINNTKTVFTAFGKGDTSDASEINLASSTTPQITVTAQPGGHSPPITTGANCSTQPCKWYHDTGFVFEGGTAGGQTCTNVTRSGDCHYEVLNTDTHEYDEGWHGGFGSGILTAATGNSLNLDSSFASQESIIDSNWGLAGIPQLGFADMGEDEALTIINHPLKNFIPVNAMWNLHCGSATTNYAGTTGCTSGSSCTVQTSCLMIGDVLVLNNNDYSGLSGCTNTDAKKVIAQLETYGSPVSDTDGASGNSNAGFYFGLKTDGTNPWPAAVFTCLGNLSYNTTNWHIITRGHF